MLPKGFPYKEDLEDGGYDSVEKLKAATNEELETVLEKDEVTEVQTYLMHLDSIQSSETSEKLEDKIVPPTGRSDAAVLEKVESTGPTGPNVSTHAEILAHPKSGAASDPSNNPNTAADVVMNPDPIVESGPGGGNAGTERERQDIILKEPEQIGTGLYRNARGTITATSEAQQPDIVSPERANELRRIETRRLRERMSEIFDA